MSIKKKSIVIILGILLLSCASPNTFNFQPKPSSEPQTVSNNSGQMLPITAKTLIGGEVIELEVATTPQQQALGLMYRSSLPKNRGMLFPFPTPRYAQFWMKNVIIGLDMVFLNDGTVKAVIPNVPPCSVDPCPVYGPPTLINQVIELPEGRAAQLGIKEGDRITIEFLEQPSK